MASGNNAQFHLNEFESNVKTYWQQLEGEDDFCDVTLACDDGHIKTHRFLISSCSPVLKNILKLNQNPHPFIYLRRVKYRVLQSLISFMYQGEVDVAKEDLLTFLEVAEDIQISGLSEKKQGEDNSKPDETPQKCKFNLIEQLPSDDNIIKHIIKTEPSLVATKSQSKLKITNHEYSNSLVAVTGKNYVSCEVCDKQFSARFNLNKHIAIVHDGVRYHCQQCNYKATQKNALQTHIDSVHDGVRYPCEFCEYKATQRGSLRIHKLNVHKGEVDVAKEDLPTFSEVTEGLQIRGLSEKKQVEYHSKPNEPPQNCKFDLIEQISSDDNIIKHHKKTDPSLVATKSQSKLKTEINEHSDSLVAVAGKNSVSCEVCEKQFSARFNLNKHIAIVHERIRYYCQQCNYKARQKNALQTHINSVHNGVRYPCELCEYKATQRGSLRIHKLNVHKTK